MIKLKILKWRNYPELSEQARCSQQYPFRSQTERQCDKRGRERSRGRGRKKQRQRLEDATLLALNMEEGAMNQ